MRDWRIWWRMLRPHTLTASFVPVFIGTSLAIYYSQINILLFLAMLIACMLIQSATNMFNEYFDYVRGLDTAESVGIGGTIVRDGIKPKTVLHLAFFFLAIAAILGLYISYKSSWWLILVGTVCMSVGYLYTGGPYPIAYTPFGELLSGFFMGLIIICISFFIQTGFITIKTILISIPNTILIGAILMSNNIRDLDRDQEKGRHTLAILLTKEKAIKFLALMFFSAYFFTTLLVILKTFSWWLLIVYISIPKAIEAIKIFQTKTLPQEMMPAMKATAQTNTFFGFLLAIGLIIPKVFL